MALYQHITVVFCCHYWYYFNMQMLSPTFFGWSQIELPQILTAGRFGYSGRNFDFKHLANHHALHLYEYYGKIRLDALEFEIKPGDITITPAGIAARYDLPRAGHHWCIHFCIGKIKKLNFSLPLHLSLGLSSATAKHKMADISKSFGRQQVRDIYSAAASAEMLSFLLWLATQKEETSSGKAQSSGMLGLKRVIEYIENNLRQSIHAEKLARIAQISPGHLSRLFAQQFNQSIPSYINTRRIQQATMLLKTTDMPIKRVGIEVGLADPHYFNRLFRNFTGQSPTAARRECRMVRMDFRTSSSFNSWPRRL